MNEVIKEFLVGLAFGVDDASLSKFSQALKSATVKVLALYATIKVAAAGIFASIAHISQGFEEMGYELRLVAPAVNKMLLLRNAMLDAYRRAGVDLTKVVKQSIAFNFSLAKTKFALEAVYKSVGARFLPMLTKQMDAFRARIFANMPKIQNTLEKFIKFVFKAFEATVIIGGRVWSILGRIYDFFVKLDETTGGWTTKVLGFVAAWKLLNLSFLASPLGMILTGLLAILALYDDFKTFEEGGESLLDWGKLTPIIDDIKTAISSVADTISNVINLVLDLVLAFKQLLSGDFSGFFDSLKRDAQDLIGVFTGLWKVVSGLGGVLGSIAGAIGDAIGGTNYLNTGHAALQSVANPAPLTSPGGGIQQNVRQQTQINVQGSADASQVGRAVASEQNKVNFDLTRNLRSVAQ